MSNWPFIVPRYAETRWASGRASAYVTDLEWPNVGVFCPHDPEPWLIGSFSVSAAVLEQKDVVHWGWDKTFVTGDGYLIHLDQTGEDGLQNIVDDAPYDREAAQRRMTDAIESEGVGPAVMALMEEKERSDRALRARVRLKCGGCGFDRVFRVEKLHRILSIFWQIGMREVEVRTLARRVDNGA